MNKFCNVAVAFGVLLATISSAQATPIYTTADFSGGISTVTGLGNSLGLSEGSVSGHVLFDQNLIPASGTGTVNIALTPVVDESNDAIFYIIFGSKPLEFEFGDPNALSSPSIQFKNGVFNGFSFVEDFTVNGKTYELSMLGASWTISWLKNNSKSDLVATGYLTVGSTGLLNQAHIVSAPSESPLTAVPEPTSIALIVVGISGIVMTRRRKHVRLCVQEIAKQELKV